MLLNMYEWYLQTLIHVAAATIQLTHADISPGQSVFVIIHHLSITVRPVQDSNGEHWTTGLFALSF